jgi:hypothetical protein
VATLPAMLPVASIWLRMRQSTGSSLPPGPAGSSLSSKRPSSPVPAQTLPKLPASLSRSPPDPLISASTSARESPSRSPSSLAPTVIPASAGMLTFHSLVTARKDECAHRAADPCPRSGRHRQSYR